MTLEVKVYVVGDKEEMECFLLPPGGVMHIPNVDPEGHDEMWVVQCRSDDVSSNFHRVYPHKIWPDPKEDPLHPRYMEYDRNESQNRGRVIEKGKSKTIYVRQRTEIPDHFIDGRYKLTHR